ncbi:MAG: M23 family metallopeptidase [Proteobacteria bacterium]|nr:M23 family metallopeptidase [Pseudomonadota bacterium]
MHIPAGAALFALCALFTTQVGWSRPVVNTSCIGDLLCVRVYKDRDVTIRLENLTTKPLSFSLLLQPAGLARQNVRGLKLDQPQTLDLATFPTPGGPWGYAIRTHYGHQAHQHDDRHIYHLPYAENRAFLVSQYFQNRSTHHPGNQFAIDWEMPVGTPVHAARGGLVVSVYAGSDQTSTARNEATANHIWIAHSDGTIGRYLHLAHQGVLVSEGQSVVAGELIGRSGNTGRSTGPHLHFSVTTLGGDDLYTSFLLLFDTDRGVRTLQAQERAVHPPR